MCGGRSSLTSSCHARLLEGEARFHWVASFTEEPVPPPDQWLQRAAFQGDLFAASSRPLAWWLVATVFNLRILVYLVMYDSG